VNKLSEKQLLILTVGVAVLLTGGLGYLIWRDLEQVKACEAKTSSLKDQIQAAQSEIDQTPVRESRVIANREITDRETAILPEETEIETFWEVIERFADESGVQIYKISNNTARATPGRKGSSSGIESVEQVLSLKATTDEFLRFMNLVENYDRIINVVEFQLSAGRSEGEDKVRHSIKLALRTFTYSKKIANTIVSIPNYEKKKESPEVKKWLSSIKIEEKETYALRTSLDRRDPFLDVRKKREAVEAGDAGPVDRAHQEAILQSIVESVRTLGEQLGMEDHLRKINDLWRLSHLMKKNREMFRSVEQMISEVQRNGYVTIPELQERFKNEAMTPFQAIRERLGKIEEEKPPLTLAQVEQIHKRIAEALDSRDWKKLAEEMRSWKDLSREGQHVVDEAKELAAEITAFQHSADAIQDFEKRKVLVSAIVYNPSGLRLAIINGKTLGEGDALDADGRVIVSEIGENYVIFTTEGVEIKKQQGSGR
jgi:Tfp pilus assembly protein PilO